MRKALQILLIATILFTACKKDGISKKSEYDKSYDKFQDFKKSSSNSYSYTATSGSVFGSSSSTTIIVINGKVTTRSYKQYKSAGNSSNSILVTQWNESVSDLGSHPAGAEVQTLDQVYDKARNIWLKADKKTNDIYFEVDSKGLIASCGYVPKGCQDDCFTGITISSVGTLILDYAR